MRNLRWALLITAFLLLATFSPAQSVDAFFGFNTLITGASPSGIPKLGGGLYPNVGGDIIFLPHGLGLGAQVAWRGGQADFLGEGERPVLYTFNAVWDPVATGARIRPDFAVGIGAESLRFYQGVYTCGTFSGCSDYVSSNHFLLHLGAGVKVYPFGGHVFFRPAVDFYNIRHNDEFDVPTAWQVGVSIGYTLGPSS